jgi:ankyrin repeat protein
MSHMSLHHLQKGRPTVQQKNPLDVHLGRPSKTKLAEVERLIAQGYCNEHAGKQGRVPLHSALLLSHKTDVVLAVIAACPQAASFPFKTRNHKLPLHIALRSTEASLAVVTALLAAHPSAIEVLTDGKICLHLALLNRVAGNVVLAILAACPPLAEFLFEGRTPLHMALSRPKVSSAVIQAMFATCPEAVRIRDKENLTPLHRAAGANVSLEILLLLLAAYPEATLMVTTEGNTPLFLAVAMNYSEEGAIPLALLEAYPDAAMVQDADGCTPLHLVARIKKTAAVMPELLAARPCAGTHGQRWAHSVTSSLEE